MKKMMLAAALFLATGTFTATFAQSKMKTKKEAKMMMPDGVMMKDNKMVMCSDNKCTPLTETYTCSDGCKIATDGTVTMKDGKTMKLKNGQGIGKDGKMMNSMSMKSNSKMKM